MDGIGIFVQKRDVFIRLSRTNASAIDWLNTPKNIIRILLCCSVGTQLSSSKRSYIAESSGRQRFVAAFSASPAASAL